MSQPPQFDTGKTISHHGHVLKVEILSFDYEQLLPESFKLFFSDFMVIHKILKYGRQQLLTTRQQQLITTLRIFNLKLCLN